MTGRIMWLTVFAALLISLLPGCFGRNFDMQAVDQIKTQREALEVLGRPQNKAKVVNSGQETWGYTWATPFGAKMATLTFDKDGNVIGRTTGK